MTCSTPARLYQLRSKRTISSLAGSVASLEEDDDLEPLQSNRLLHLEELELEPRELVDVVVLLPRFLRGAPIAHDPPALLDAGFLLRVLQDLAADPRLLRFSHGQRGSV